MIAIRKAVKGRQKIRMGIIGPTGSGKTWTALTFAEQFVAGTDLRVGMIDSERESSELYADRFDFDVIQLTESHDPAQYVAALKAFADAGNYGVVVVDSLSHAWMGKDGVQEQLDKYAKRNKGDSFGGWREMTPVHNRFVDALLAAPYHLIGTLRAKMEHVRETDAHGKTVVRKIGMQPVQRDGMEYEFTVVCDLDVDHNLIVGKTRCSEVDGMVLHRPDGMLARTLRAWIESGEVREPTPGPSPFDPVEIPEIDKAKPEAATDAQYAMLREMVGNPVFKDHERESVLTAIEEGMTKVQALDWIEQTKQTIARREAKQKPEPAGVS